MRAFQVSASVDPSGSIRVSNLPFEAGAQVEVVIVPRRNREEELRRIEALFRRTQSVPGVQSLTDEEIQAEIDAHRDGR